MLLDELKIFRPAARPPVVHGTLVDRLVAASGRHRRMRLLDTGSFVLNHSPAGRGLKGAGDGINWSAVEVSTNLRSRARTVVERVRGTFAGGSARPVCTGRNHGALDRPCPASSARRPVAARGSVTAVVVTGAEAFRLADRGRLSQCR